MFNDIETILLYDGYIESYQDFLVIKCQGGGILDKDVYAALRNIEQTNHGINIVSITFNAINERTRR